MNRNATPVWQNVFKNFYKHIKEQVLGLLYPETCPFCEEILENRIRQRKQLHQRKQPRQTPPIHCHHKLPYITGPRCMKCGKPLRYEEREYCHDCKKHPHDYEQGRSVWLHQGMVADSIYRFKYHNRRIYGKTYGMELIRLYRHTIEMWQPDVIIPVPLHWRRRRRRGYNQAEILGRYLSEGLDLPMNTRAVYRKRYTNPQKVLDHQKRHINLQGAFVCREEEVKGIETVVVVDDIYTTGATIDEVARTLKNKGVKKVYFLTISIGQGL